MRTRWSTGRFFEDKIISNHVVTDQLFRYLTKSELLECSLVSKKWIVPCRQFLHRHYDCLLRVEARELETALATLKLLDDCNEIFYNGISSNMPNFRSDISRILRIVGSIFKKLPTVKYLTLRPAEFEIFGSYHGFSVRNRVPEIEYLKVIGRTSPGAWETIFKREEFSSLKEAIIPNEWYGYNEFGDILKRVLFSSPNLQEWSSGIKEFHIQYFAQANKLATIKTVYISNSIDPDLLDQFEAANVTLRRFGFYLSATAENVEIFRRMTSSSTASYKEIQLGYDLYIILIITPGIRPLINVKEIVFTTFFERGRFESITAEIEADINAQRIFQILKLS